ncbi:MAG: glycosyltransferase [Deltaproteobacteria bacterium]|nr:glycosyltransferase [Deltaproteobacteria bacterium]
MRIIIPSRTSKNLFSCLSAIEARDPMYLRQTTIIDNGLAERPPTPGLEFLNYQPTEGFCYAEAVNLGIKAHPTETTFLLLNDDAILQTPDGIRAVEEALAEDPSIAVLSASIDGTVSNPLQRPWDGPSLRYVRDRLAFVATAIRHLDRIGLLDERFRPGYGSEDTDFCWRARLAGYQLAVTPRCVFEHGFLPSTFRSMPDIEKRLGENRALLQQKWGRTDPFPRRGDTDILFPTFNRPEYTRASLASLFAHTNFDRVGALYFHDDGSEPKTLEIMEQARIIASTFIPAYQLRGIEPQSGPIEALRSFALESDADFLIKIDNDTYLCPQWLERAFEVLESDPDIHLLGIEPFIGYSTNVYEPRSFRESPYIGGIGVFRRNAFSSSLPVAKNIFHGFQEFQAAHPELKRGWLDPGLPIVLLDRIPTGKWRALGQQYEERGWQRPWKRYDPEKDRALLDYFYSLKGEKP